MAVGRISGPLLKSNLIRNGIDLAFETDLLYLDVNNQRIGVKTASPTHELQINGTTRTTDLIVDNSADIADINIVGTTISTSQPYLNLGTFDNVVYQNKLRIDTIDIEGNVISTNASNADLELRPNGTGIVQITSDLNVDGNIHATGNISADGNITLGDADTDNVTFNAEIASDIIPDATDTYALGSDPSTGGKEWRDVYVNNLIASSVNSNDLEVEGIDLTLRQGNIFYVAENGDDANSGNHIQDPVATVKFALSLASAGDTIHIFPGTYTEEFPLTVPAGVTVKGESIRGVFIQPTAGTNNKDAFLLNGESTIHDLTVGNYYYDSLNNTGYAFRFASGASVTTRSPYIKNITVITAGSVITAEDPRGFDTGDAGKGAYIDGSVIDSGSKEASMLFHSATFITPGVDAITCTNGVRVEWLNSFTYFAEKSVYCLDGNLGKYSDGKTKLTLSGVSGTFTAENTLILTSTDGSTVLSGTIHSVDGNDVFVEGYLDLSGFDLTPQSITDGTATATAVDSFDLREFGAEVRMIGSASVYGNFGLYGDGAGVLVYAIGHNLAYIGVGKEVTNEPEAVIQDNEVVEINDAKIRFVSVDHQGDFRVGDLFFVDQQTGNISFANANFNISTTGGVTFTDGIDSVFVNGTRIDVGNFRISGNTLETLSGDANIQAFSNQINLNSDVNISGNLDVTGNVTIGGNITIGDEASDTVQFVAGIDSDIIPAETDTYNLGTQTFKWKGLFVNQANVDDIEINNNYITTTVSNADLELRANGTGKILIPNNDLEITNDVTVNGTTTLATTNINGDVSITGTLNQTGDIAVTGTVNVQQDLDITGSAQFEDILVDDNFITTTASNSDLELRAAGTGRVLVPQNNVEITNDLSVGGDIDVVNITATGNIQAQSFTTGDILIDDNFITTTESNSDLELRANGTGNVVVPENDIEVSGNLTVSGDTDFSDTTITGTILHTGDVSQTGNFVLLGEFTNGNILLEDNFITTTESNSDLELRANGTGNVLIPDNNVEITNNLSVNGDTELQDTTIAGTITHTGNTTQTGNIALVGNLAVTGFVTISGTTQFEDVQINDNVITTTQSNSDLELRTSGTGQVIIPENDVEITNNLSVIGSISAANLTSTGTISANRFTTGDIIIDDNFISTTQSNSNLELRANGTGDITVPNNDVVLEQNLTVDGISDLDAVTVNGVITHTGNTEQTGDLDITGAMIIDGNLSATGIITFDDIEIDGNSITTRLSNSDLELGASGSGIVSVPSNDVDIAQDLTVGGTLSTGSLTATGTITANSFSTGDILIDDNFITTTLSSSDLELRTAGTGDVVIDDFRFTTSTIESTGDFTISPASDLLIMSSTGSVRIPVGDTSQRPTPSTGQIRYNTDLDRFEGYNGSNWIILHGVEDLDGDTRITAELSQGANDNIVRFYIADDELVTVDSDKLSAHRVIVDEIQIDGNVISTTNSNTDLELQTQGTGSVVIDNFSINNNTITNTISNSVTEFQNTANGYVKFAGASGFVLPVGTNSDRPPVLYTETGMTRFNTDDSRVEVWDGSNWVSVAGTSAGISRGDAEDIAFEIVLSLG